MFLWVPLFCSAASRCSASLLFCFSVVLLFCLRNCFFVVLPFCFCTLPLHCFVLLFFAFLFLCFSACLIFVLFVFLLVHVFVFVFLSVLSLQTTHNLRYVFLILLPQIIGQYVSWVAISKVQIVANSSRLAISRLKHFNTIPNLPKECGKKNNWGWGFENRLVIAAGDIFYFWTSVCCKYRATWEVPKCCSCKLNRILKNISLYKQCRRKTRFRTPTTRVDLSRQAPSHSAQVVFNFPVRPP